MINNPALTPNTSVAKFSKCVNDKATLAANIAIAVINNNPKRMYAAFINNGQDDITLTLDDKLKAVIDEGIVIRGNGGSYEITLINLYIGKVSAISAINSQLSFVECSE